MQTIDEISVNQNTEVMGDMNSTVILGMIALFQAVTPLFLSQYMESSTAITYNDYAWSSYTIGNMFIWGFLAVLWPLTYFKIDIIYTFYLAYYETMGL